ncbi:Crp/Fnr family transcriptional regulator [Tropicimonas isoalkanivorans]|uniref:Cyclic nucleotide-binding domain-containing protein n=1 Tax=Tropicimonas isoalkanivorans TaxID=441112 RepID=A0A1I1E623_9RHOB|nr:Crp/Fnr family transcriptional regulator [Tropicimonas isoalkanivorans]SFB82675.1 Cyclic nucleotide-binding domain-containing protein [Tropicimonas isoalkanivorans]
MATHRSDPESDGCELTKVARFDRLDSGVRDALEAICRTHRYRAGQTVARSGETLDTIGCVRSGFLRMQKRLADGRQHVVGLLVEGDMFGRVFDGALHFAIEAATEAEVCTFRRAPFEELLVRMPDLERMVLLNILNELDRARDWMIILSCPRVSGRIAGFLLVLCSRFAGIDHLFRAGRRGPEVRIPISRADLAHLLGTRPESISRGFHALAEAGYIEILRPDRIGIRDLTALAAEAGDDDLALGAGLVGGPRRTV